MLQQFNFPQGALQFNVIVSSIRVTKTCMMGVAPAASSGSACRVERKVSEPSKPRPDRKAPITGITDSSRSSQRTKPCRYCSLNTLRNMQLLNSSTEITVQLKHYYSQFHFKVIHPNGYSQVQEEKAAFRKLFHLC